MKADTLHRMCDGTQIVKREQKYNKTLPVQSGRACPCCDGEIFEKVLHFSDIPSTGQYRTSLTEELCVAELIFYSCVRCGLLELAGDKRVIDYTGRDRGTTRQLPTYQEKLLKAISDFACESDHIIEVGSNDGAFLRSLREAGLSNCSGIEPAQSLSRLSRESGIRTKTGYLTISEVPEVISEMGNASFVVSRHTLEHISDPAGFLKAVYKLVEKEEGNILLEVPDGEHMVSEGKFWELWDEHLYYYNAFNLEMITRKQGFKNIQLKTFDHLETKNIVLTGAVEKEKPLNTQETNYSGFRYSRLHFFEKFKSCKENLQSVVRGLPKPIHVLGASHPQCNFVNYLELGDLVHFFIDDDPEKIGKYPPVKFCSERIVSTNDFMENATAGSVLMTGFGYPKWSKHIREICDQKKITTIDPIRDFQ